MAEENFENSTQSARKTQKEKLRQKFLELRALRQKQVDEKHIIYKE